MERFERKPAAPDAIEACNQFEISSEVVSLIRYQFVYPARACNVELNIQYSGVQVNLLRNCVVDLVDEWFSHKQCLYSILSINGFRLLF